MLETTLGLVIVVWTAWLVLGVAEGLLEFGTVVDANSMDTILFNTGFDCGDTLVIKDLIEYGIGEVAFWGGGNWIDVNLRKLRKKSYEKDDNVELTQEEKYRLRFSRLKHTGD